jgi:N-hydroxyarylamine O-acetyltransferase
MPGLRVKPRLKLLVYHREWAQGGEIPSPIQDDPTLAPLPKDVIDRYLAILGVARMEGSLATLRALVSAHLTRIPFENISKLYYYKRLGLTNLPGIRMYLQGIEEKHFGGTCYSNNYYFHRLLRSLGYEAKLCAADMKTPDVHAVNVITIDGREYFVDTGYAAPLLEPIPRDLTTDYEIALGRDRYVLTPQDGNGCSRLQLYRDGVLRHGYLVKPKPRKIEDFSTVIRESFSPNATFLNSVLLARFRPDGSTVIHNLTLIESEGDKSTLYELANRDELIATIEQQFGMPPGIVREAIRGLGSLQNAWS